MNIITNSINAVKDSYKDRHGFYIRTVVELDDLKLNFISKTLMENEYVNEGPEIVIQEDRKNHLFVYRAGASFDSPRFIKIGEMSGKIFKQWEITLLSEL